ncbi:plectin [Ruminococcus albus]|jgi:myosin heavy subunit|uniref:Plectin n=1 Tax=Ruminococcus albus SY3 TaxID=1341156 RepID=A0A011VZ81_RUMAL|nr:plectin [Ruminococcus albus]EXM40631.1 plectin [Ruminococcus albus SY3]MBE6868664.1 plectin [Ruminococcus albus]
MADTRFIRTVEFGGYDRNDVIKRFEFLNTQLFDLKNELRETKMLIEEYKKGSSEEKAHEAVLTQEKVKLTSLQVQNETASTKLKAAEEDKAKLAEELTALKATHADTLKELEDIKAKLNAYESDNEANALSQVFIAAQASATAVVANANKEAEEKKAQTEELIKEMIDDANHTAAEIVYEAEKRAAETDAESKNSAEKMKVASNNLRAAMLQDVEALGKHLTELNDAFALIKDKSAEAEKLLKTTENKLTEGGVPEFKLPETFEAELPDAPEPRKVPEQSKKSNARLDELAKMAAAIGGEKNKDDDGETKGEEKADDKSGDAPAEKPAGDKKSGGVDLADLMKKANSLKK